MDARNGSSSPDPLSYPGDPSFLLSSAAKPFSQRKLSMTPFKSRSPGKPWPLKSKDQNGKIARSIQYPDIILPSTPSGSRFDRKSLSPTKTTLHSESNISPWRIRVTVEAERDDEEETNDAVQNAVSNWVNGNTLKIPLKGGDSSAAATPKKRRGRSRKSDVSTRVPTPGKRKSATPFDSVFDSAQKRKRGRPRKTLEPVDENSPSPVKSTRDLPSEDDPFLDIAQDNVRAPTGQPEAYDNLYPMLHPNMRRSTTPNGDFLPEATPMDNVGVVLDSENQLVDSETSRHTQEETGLSPINVTFAGHTPRPKFRLYPTPTSSSQLGEEPPEETNIHSAAKTGVVELEKKRNANPTEEHREFDSIMESEGFSMVSLNSLPSAKQNLFSSLQGTSTRPVTIKDSFQNISEQIQTKAAKSLEQGSHLESRLHCVATVPSKLPVVSLPQPQTSANDVNLISPALPGDAEQVSRWSPLVRLVRIIRVGISFQRILRRNWTILRMKDSFNDPNDSQDYDSEATRRRLDESFRNFNMETQRELCAGLRFGEVLAQRIREAHKKRRIQVNRDDSLSISDSGDVQYPTLDLAADDGQSLSTISQYDYQATDQVEGLVPADENLTEKINMEMARREAEWQRERQAISRQIEAANASQVIVIDSDDDDASAIQSPSKQEDEMKSEPGNHIVAEADDYEDIWQQEARDGALHSESPSFADVSHDDTVHPRRNPLPIKARVDHDQDQELLPELSWSAHGKKYPMVSLGKSQLARYRDNDFEFSSLIATPESSTRRFIEGRSASTESSSKRLNIIPANVAQRDSPGPAVDDKTEAQTEVETEAKPLESTQQQRRVYAPSSDSISELPPPPSLKYTGSDIVTNEQDEPSALGNSSREPGLQEERHWDRISAGLRYEGDRVESHLNEAVQSDLDMEDIDLTSDLKEREPAVTTSWYNRLTGLAPKWLVASRPAKVENQPSANRTQHPLQPIPSQPMMQEQPYQSYPRMAPRSEQKAKRASNKPLALSGYFTDDHYVALRRVYRKAKELPHLFPYVPTPERDAMLGKWMWSADGHHHRQVTEIQLAIVDKYRRDLIEASRRRGGSDNLEWSEEDILWRLFSIIVGEKLRRERKRQYAIENNVDELGDIEIPDVV
ncbi:hypothetical protein PRK78_000418 [Emydomyces testavorans]|uniref:AT DNA binding protein n=1 Tax=Emydomyces testavorans TaxID=2070801 RepID=A0AAF0DAN4_9EURO|nr:hypothetical protein PRK78_000418 [Emydomyces testavorans]